MIAALAPLAASAEMVELVIETVELVPGEPGHLMIDASIDGRVQIPIPEETLKFETRSDFVDFMVQNFNAKVALDENDKPYWYTLHQTVLGDPLYFDGGEWFEAGDPVALMVGGREGYVEIEGQIVCLNPAFCKEFLSSAIPMAESFNRFCGEFVCGETTVLSWDPVRGLQKIKIETTDRRWGRGVPYLCGYWPTYPKPTPKYCVTIQTYPNVLSHYSVFFLLDECKFDGDNPFIPIQKKEQNNLKRITEIHDRGGWYDPTNLPAASGATWHGFFGPGLQPPYAEWVPTSFNNYNQYNFDCRRWAY